MSHDMETYALLHSSYRKRMLKYEVEPLAGTAGRHIDKDDVEKASACKPCGYEAGSRRAIFQVRPAYAIMFAEDTP
jgi:hypothetical protein